jgi:CNT family concentrative nucleoside transporter
MSIPASLAVSKMRMPETEEPITEGRVVIPPSDEPKKVNALHAFSDGAWVGLLVAGMIVTNLLVIIALVALIDALLGWIGGFFQVPQLTLTFILGYLLYPVAALLGVPSPDIYNVAQLIGIKVIQNEFVAFTALSSTEPYVSMSPRAQLIATYALCGFGNVGSLGIQIGVLGQLGGLKKKKVFAQVAMSALLTGVLATLMSASIAGMVLMDQTAVTNTT